MPSGASSFSDVTLNKAFNPYSLQWNDGYLILASNGDCDCQDPTYLYQVQISEDYGTVVRTTDLYSLHDKNAAGAQFWIQGKHVVGPGSKDAMLQIWRYPAGGSSVKTLKRVNPRRRFT